MGEQRRLNTLKRLTVASDQAPTWFKSTSRLAQLVNFFLLFHPVFHYEAWSQARLILPRSHVVTRAFDRRRLKEKSIYFQFLKGDLYKTNMLSAKKKYEESL